MKPAIARALCAVLILLLPATLSGCGSGYADGMAFTYALPQNIDSLDPQTAANQSSYQVIASVFEGLCRIGPQGDVLPGAARKWESADNDTRFTFHLYPEAQWSNGDPVTADDFLFAIQRALRPETATPSVDDLFIIQGARAIYKGEATEDQLGVWAQDAHTLVVQLERSYADFPALTAGTHYMPCNRAYFESCSGHYGLSGEYLITNGPFTLSTVYSWNTDYGSRKVELSPSSLYHRADEVTPGKLTYLVDYDEALAKEPVAALASGSIDITTLPETAAKAAAEQGCGIQMLDDAVTGLLLNPEAGVLKYPQAREIFVRTLDRQSLLDRRTDKNSTEAMGIMANCVRWGGGGYYDDGATMFPSQDDGVLQSLLPALLTELETDRLPEITVICPNDEESINIANGLLVSWNSKLNNAFNISPLSDEEFQSRIASGNFQAALYTLRAGGTTPYQVLKAFESTSSPTLLNDAEYDNLLHSIQFGLSEYRNLETYLLNRHIFYPLFSDKTYYVTSPNSQGITAAPDLSIDFSQAKKKE
ncbi:peptide ABC transporter substrate-binding protein [Acutalibacter caecimuris]|uniref:peptide ABC transporter substrate-binding protein n=1 Tax=Acutalibacter caecimuris TaxID=3093657 RepID=UPI002AC94D9F|nr:peptide ABC transporter substrate-binding protein [Acutalibacter sp. M00118]